MSKKVGEWREEKRSEKAKGRRKSTRVRWLAEEFPSLTKLVLVLV